MTSAAKSRRLRTGDGGAVCPLPARGRVTPRRLWQKLGSCSKASSTPSQNIDSPAARCCRLILNSACGRVCRAVAPALWIYPKILNPKGGDKVCEARACPVIRVGACMSVIHCTGSALASLRGMAPLAGCGSAEWRCLSLLRPLLSSHAPCQVSKPTLLGSSCWQGHGSREKPCRARDMHAVFWLLRSDRCCRCHTHGAMRLLNHEVDETMAGNKISSALIGRHRFLPEAFFFSRKPLLCSD